MAENLEGIQPWPEIQQRCLSDFNVTWLPDSIGEYALALADNLSANVNMTAFSALLVSSIATQGASVQVKDNWEEPTNLYGLIIAERGQKKSQILRPFTRPVFSFEAVENNRRKDDISRDKGRLNMLKNKLKGLEKELSKDRDNKDLQEQIMSTHLEIDRFSPTRPIQIVQDDITPEALAQKMADNDGYGAIVSSEGGAFDTFSGMYSKGVANIDILLKSYTVEPVRVTRKNLETDIVLDSPNLCVLFAVQPHVLTKCIENPEFLNRGLIDRFLFCPVEEDENHIAFNTPPVPSALSDGYTNRIEKLLSDRGHEHVLALSAAARNLFSEYYEKTENSKHEEDTLVCPYMSKLCGKTARIAGVLSILSGENVISEKTMNNAIHISEWSLDNARHVLGQSTLEQRQTDYIISRLKHKGVRSCTGHDLLKWCANKGLGLSAAKDFDSVKTYMVDNGYLRINRGTGIEYDFNPLLFE